MAVLSNIYPIETMGQKWYCKDDLCNVLSQEFSYLYTLHYAL